MTSYQRRFLRIRVTHSRSCYHRLVGTKRVTQGLGPEKIIKYALLKSEVRTPLPTLLYRLHSDGTSPHHAFLPPSLSVASVPPPTGRWSPLLLRRLPPPLTSLPPPPPVLFPRRHLSFSYRSGWSLRLSSAQAGVAPGAAGGGGSGRGRQGSLRQRRMWPQLVSVTVCNLFSPGALQRRRVGSRAPASVRTLPLLSPSPQHLLLKQGLPDH